MRVREVAAACAVLATACATAPTTRPELPALARQVEVRRTAEGVPHILAENLRAGAFALAYVQLEDHGPNIIRGMQAARGRLALVEGSDFIDADARARRRHARAVETFHQLGEDTRDVYTGFAEGMNHFIRVYRDELPDWMRPDFTGPDILARDVGGPGEGPMNALRRRLVEDPADPALLVLDEDGTWRRAAVDAARSGTEARRVGGESEARGAEESSNLAIAMAASEARGGADEDQNVGSNAWALAPRRTTSGRAILLRNPHLSWTAGYYEAHLRVPDKLDFYGDFRIGGPFTVIGGFNAHLGFATTNNASRSHEFYAFRTDPARPDHIVLDGESLPLRRDVVTVEFRDANGNGTESREFLSSPFGPIVHDADSIVYVYRPTTLDEFRAGEQWLEMMKATSLEEWKDAMRIQARTTSNFTYADRDGNIFYVWVAAAPALPHPAGGDSLAILATHSDQIWSRLVPFDSLPQLLNPSGGYLHNENDSPHYTNLHHVMADSFRFWVEPPRLRLRSQHALELLHNDREFSLEDVVEAKHSMRMLLADRVKADLIVAVRSAAPAGEIARALELLADWDNTVTAGSRGGVLFETWWNRYRALIGDAEPHAIEWTPDEPTTTPRGLADLERAVEAFEWAVTEAQQRYGGWDVPWGHVHRVRRGDVDVPVGGCGGALGCFRVLNFQTHPDGKRVVNGGDGWVIAVEFDDTPRAYSVLAYGQSPNPVSPWHANQAAMFAANEMKPVAWTEADIERASVTRYRPGEEPRPRTTP